MPPTGPLRLLSPALNLLCRPLLPRSAATRAASSAPAAKLRFDPLRPNVPRELVVKPAGKDAVSFPVHEGVPMMGLLGRVASLISATDTAATLVAAIATAADSPTTTRPPASVTLAAIAAGVEPERVAVHWCGSIPLATAVKDALATNANIVLELKPNASFQGACEPGGRLKALSLDDNSLPIPKTIPIAIPTLAERASELNARFLACSKQLEALELVKAECDERARSSTARVVWTGLAALCVQWGLMARLTWWEYSWDVMEPIAYFVTFGTAIGGYMFFVVTRREYTYEIVANMVVSRRQQKQYDKRGLDLAAYSKLCLEKDDLKSRLIECGFFLKDIPK